MPGLPSDSSWWKYLYATCVLAFCLLVSLVGGHMYGKTNVFTLVVSHGKMLLMCGVLLLSAMLPLCSVLVHTLYVQCDVHVKKIMKLSAIFAKLFCALFC